MFQYQQFPCYRKKKKNLFSDLAQKHLFVLITVLLGVNKVYFYVIRIVGCGIVATSMRGLRICGLFSFPQLLFNESHLGMLAVASLTIFISCTCK